MIYPWQTQQWQHISAQLEQQRLPHAMLFAGQRGLGKQHFALLLAQRLLCEAPNEGYGCGHCRGCQLFAAGSHPDFYEVTLQDKSKVIKIDQIRELTGKLNETSQRDGYQVAIIRPAETMNRASANALLKTLEEPAGSVALILISHNVSTLPATILSRCQKMLFSSNNNAATVQWLNSQLSDDQGELLLSLADNAPLRAVQLAEQNYLKLRDTVLRHMMMVWINDADPLTPLAGWAKEEVPLLLDIMQSLLLDLQRVQLGAASKIHHTDRAEPLINLAKNISQDSLNRILNKVQKDRQLLLSGLNPNLQLLLEGVMLTS